MTTVVRACLAVSLILVSLNARAVNTWDGYVNDKTFNNIQYGYLFTTDKVNTDRKLRVVCHAPETYKLYVDTEGVFASTGPISFKIDSLPELIMTGTATRNAVIISNQHKEFWNLLAQMVAGTSLRLTVNNQPVHTYNLHGFTALYTEVCGWIKSSDEFRHFLSSYR